MTLETIGFWFNERAPSTYPRPQLLVGAWHDHERAAVLRYLRSGETLCDYMGTAHCRFACSGVSLGSRDLTDGTWAWPEGLAHYVERHEVRLPERFVAHVMARGGVVAPFAMPPLVAGILDDGPWLAWSRAQGACLDLTGWEIPSWSDARRIADDLPDVHYDYVALCNPGTREVVLALDDSSLEIHQLTPGGRAPRRVAGWHAWPVAT